MMRLRGLENLVSSADPLIRFKYEKMYRAGIIVLPSVNCNNGRVDDF